MSKEEQVKDIIKQTAAGIRTTMLVNLPTVDAETKEWAKKVDKVDKNIEFFTTWANEELIKLLKENV